MPFYIYAWIGSFVSGLFVLVAKLTSKHSISNPWLFNFFLAFSVFVFMVPLTIAKGAGFPSDWWPIILDAFFATLFYITWVFATYLLDITTLTPLFNFRGVFTVLFGAMFFSERFVPSQSVYIGIILIAGLFTSMDEKFSLKSFFRKNIFIGILAACFLAVENVFVKYALLKNDFWTMNLWVSIFSVLFTMPTIFLFHRDLKKIKFNQIAPMGLMGIFETGSILFSNRAYADNIAITSLIMNIPFSMILAFAFSILAPKLLEKHSLKIYAIRFGTTAVMIWAAMQLTK